MQPTLSMLALTRLRGINMNLYTSLLKLGSLEVVTKTGLSDVFFWFDTFEPSGYGPFFTLLDCMTHYAKVIKNSKAGIPMKDHPDAGIVADTMPEFEEKDGELIEVDFQAKTRLKKATNQ